jgi:hypothetical protein
MAGIPMDRSTLQARVRRGRWVDVLGEQLGTGLAIRLVGNVLSK